MFLFAHGKMVLIPVAGHTLKKLSAHYTANWSPDCEYILNIFWLHVCFDINVYVSNYLFINMPYPRWNVLIHNIISRMHQNIKKKKKKKNIIYNNYTVQNLLFLFDVGGDISIPSSILSNKLSSVWPIVSARWSPSKSSYSWVPTLSSSSCP